MPFPRPSGSHGIVESFFNFSPKNAVTFGSFMKNRYDVLIQQWRI
jgi:hypothetical protein